MARVSKSKAYIFWFLCFVGICGAHRFYLGHPCTGIIYLLSFGLFGIGQIIDLFLLPRLIRNRNNRKFKKVHAKLRHYPRNQYSGSPLLLEESENRTQPLPQKPLVASQQAIIREPVVPQQQQAAQRQPAIQEETESPIPSPEPNNQEILASTEPPLPQTPLVASQQAITREPVVPQQQQAAQRQPAIQEETEPPIASQDLNSQEILVPVKTPIAEETSIAVERSLDQGNFSPNEYFQRSSFALPPNDQTSKKASDIDKSYSLRDEILTLSISRLIELANKYNGQISISQASKHLKVSSKYANRLLHIAEERGYAKSDKSLKKEEKVYFFMPENHTQDMEIQ
ncbi:MAG: TM2 domain-containing protein [Leptolyngbya sp. SIO1D8]|nr:TM2 domain-containing protein [Leptolyngbya sp. SIO1D8]